VRPAKIRSRYTRRHLRRNHAREAGKLGGVEEDERGTYDECNGIELGDTEVAERVGDGDRAHRHAAYRIAQDHCALAVPAIDECARGQAQCQIGKRLRGGDQAGLCRGARKRQNEEREGDVRDTAAEARHRLAAEQQQEIAAAPEWRRVQRLCITDSRHARL